MIRIDLARITTKISTKRPTLRYEYHISYLSYALLTLAVAPSIAITVTFSPVPISPESVIALQISPLSFI
jgi:hypothetical protein